MHFIHIGTFVKPELDFSEIYGIAFFFKLVD
jgi:hypothetical protein